MFISRICNLILILAACQCSKASVKNGLTELIEKIFKIELYNPLVRPIDPITGLTIVSTELKIIQIDIVIYLAIFLVCLERFGFSFKVLLLKFKDEKYQELVSTVWMEMSWVDHRLSWDISEYGNITEITLPVSKLWVRK
jgi:hypothetical protein